jgi:hypothetical protein
LKADFVGLSEAAETIAGSLRRSCERSRLNKLCPAPPFLNFYPLLHPARGRLKAAQKASEQAERSGADRNRN